MSPDENKLRQRIVLEDEGDDATLTTDERLSSLKGLKGNEIAIDGIIYNIQNLKHPGGETIHIFGGTDATTHYKMIHPYHTTKHLEKMKRVGKVTDYGNAVSSEYKFDSPFAQEVKREVFRMVRPGREFGTWGYHARALFFICFFFRLQYQWVVHGTSMKLAIYYGLAHALIGLNVQHDANHGAVSREPWVNNLLGWGADFIGGNKVLWMEKHWLHHAFTNHPDKDPDGAAGEPFLLFNDYQPRHPKRSAIHAYQVFYFVFVLTGYWISSIFCFAEVYDLQERGARRVGEAFPSTWIKKQGKYALGMRLLYLLTNLIIPSYKNFSWNTVAHIYFMGVVGSLALGLLFILSHNFENVARDPTEDARTTGRAVCWYKAQVETSSTYGGFIAGSLTGGLNFQVEHHLFPRMNSAWYPYIAPTVRRVCAKHGVKYTYYPWVWQNMISTMKYLHAIGTGYWKQNPFKGEL